VRITNRQFAHLSTPPVPGRSIGEGWGEGRVWHANRCPLCIVTGRALAGCMDDKWHISPELTRWQRPSAVHHDRRTDGRTTSVPQAQYLSSSARHVAHGEHPLFCAVFFVHYKYKNIIKLYKKSPRPGQSVVSRPSKCMKWYLLLVSKKNWNSSGNVEIGNKHILFTPNSNVQYKA